jgi:methylated-DNA-[protein]-cysteine S-methyltransferase
MTLLYTTLSSPLGDLLLVGDRQALRRLHMQAGRRPLAIDPRWRRDDQAFEPAVRELKQYFDGDRRDFDLPLELRGSKFELRVWQALREIPYGHTATYGELARAIGERGGARAVGVATARNPIAVFVPCHRVIGADGTLTGYAGGLERKRLLLDLESGVLPLAA